MMKIPIVDDSPTHRAGVSRLVGKMGYGAIQAGNCGEAFELYERGRPDLVMSDVMRPMTDGGEAARRMRARRDLRTRARGLCAFARRLRPE